MATLSFLRSHMRDFQDQQSPKYRSVLIACVCYIGLAIIATWPLSTSLPTHLPGASTDALIHYWNGWWVQQALDQGLSPFYTNNVFYPDGVGLVTHNLAWLNIVPWLGLEPLLDNGILAYNLVVLLNLVACGLAMYLLAYRLTGLATAAFVAGVIYQLWPYRLAQLDHPNLVATQWLPIFLLFLGRTVENGRWRDALFTGIAFALVGYTRWQLLIPATLMGAVYFISTAKIWFSGERRSPLFPLLAAASVAIILLLPPALLLRQAQQTETAANLLFLGEEATMQTDALAYVTPSNLHPLWKSLTQPLYAHYYADRFDGRIFPAYLGIITMALALLGIYYRRRSSLVWIILALMLMSLAAGAAFRFNGQLYEQIPTLYRFLSPLTLFRLMRVPDRFNMFLALPLAVLAAFGTAGLATIAMKRAKTLLIVGLLTILIAADYWLLPIPLQDVSGRPTYYEQLVDEPGAVYNIPFNLIKSKRYMFDQTLHQRPILQGKVARLPEDVYNFIDSSDWLREVRQYNEIPFHLNEVSRHLAALAAANVHHLILHKDQMPADQADRWQRYLGLIPRYEDGRIAIYATTPKAGQDFRLLQELLPGLGPTAVRLSANCLNPGKQLTIDVDWGTTGTLGQNVAAQFSLTNSAGQSYQSESQSLLEQWPTRQSAAITLARGFYVWPLPTAMATAEYDLNLSLTDLETGQVLGQPMIIQPVFVQADACPVPPIPEARLINGRFGDDLRLLAYQAQLSPTQLHLTLYWRGEQRLTTDYKVFIHLFDPATGVPTAQDDAVPRQWQFPTSLWWPGDIITDTISISLDTVPVGQYGLAVGAYDSQTGDRLPVIDGEGQKAVDGRLLLPETVAINPE